MLHRAAQIFLLIEATLGRCLGFPDLLLGFGAGLRDDLGRSSAAAPARLRPAAGSEPAGHRSRLLSC